MNRKDTSFSVILTNLRGFKSKQYYLKKIIKKVKPSIVMMNETHLVGNMEVSLTPYTCWTKNRTEQGGGGIAPAVNQKFKDSAVGAGEG